MAKKQVFNTDKFVEKVISLTVYDSTLLTNLYINPVNQQKINRGAAFLIKNYFDQYMDAKARQNPKAYHHVYEFNQTGQSSARLFKANISNTPDGSAIISYNFTSAKVPNDYGYAFPDKAEVMEKNDPIVILPKKKEYLKYILENGQFVTSKKSIVENPGGKEVANSFETTFGSFMATQPGIILQKFRFFNMIENSIIQKRKMATPRLNKGIIADANRLAKIDSDQIAQGVNAYYV